MNKKRQRAEIGGENGFEEWGGYMAAKKSKLQEQFQNLAAKQKQASDSDIFKNVSIFVNGYTVPSADALKQIMMDHGGNYEHYLSPTRVTHIIASNLPDVKIKKLKSLHANIVKPEWITACLNAGRQVDFRPFLLYSHQSTSQPSIRSFTKSVAPLSPIKKDPLLVQSIEDEPLEKNDEVPPENNCILENRDSSEDLFASPELEENNRLSSTSKTTPASETYKKKTTARCSKREPSQENNCKIIKCFGDQESSQDLFSSPELEEIQPTVQTKPSELKQFWGETTDISYSFSEGSSVNTGREKKTQEKLRSQSDNPKDVCDKDEGDSHGSSGDIFTSPELQEIDIEKACLSSLKKAPDLSENSNDSETSTDGYPVNDGFQRKEPSQNQMSSEILPRNHKSDLAGSRKGYSSVPEIDKIDSKGLSVSSNEIQDFKRGIVDDRNSAKCATDPNFLSEFYNNSRLHHISTIGAMFKQYISEMRQKKNNAFGLMRLKEWQTKNPEKKKELCGDEEDFSEAVNLNDSKAHLRDLQSPSGQVIMHIDMDCFFVSVGLRKYPDLQGKPVAVTHSKGNSQLPRNGSDRKAEFAFYKERVEATLNKNGTSSNEQSVKERLAWMEGIEETDSMAEIASCSYEARKKGVKNGMFMGAALKLCPDLQVIPYDFEGYKEVAYSLYNTVASYTLDIEAVSCDEMFVDCTKLLAETGCSPLQFASFLRQEIKEKTQCSASTGFGSNRLLARLATRKAKPNGMFHLETSAVAEFMKTVNIKDLPGVGRAMASRLESMGASTCGDLQKISLSKLRTLGPKTGDVLFAQCRGQDDRPLNFDHQRKTVTAEVNYGIRFERQAEVDVFLRQLALEVQKRLNEAKVKGRCITLKLMVRAVDAPTDTAKYLGHGVCNSYNKSSTLSRSTSDAEIISGEALRLMRKTTCVPSDLRGIGITISQLEGVGFTSSALDRFLVNYPASSEKSRNETDLGDLNANVNSFSSGVKKPNDKFGNPPSILEEKINSMKTSPEKKKANLPKGTVGIDKYMVARKKSSRKDEVSKLPSPKDLDLDVLGALPDNIRQEILEAYSHETDADINLNKVLYPSETKNGKTYHPCNLLESVTSTSELEISYSQVDPTFLEALPVEMRRELEADFQQKREHKKKDCKKHSLLSNTNDYVQPGPSYFHHQKTVSICGRSESILKNLMEPKEVKTMLKQWISQERHPQPCDVHILKHYFNDLVQGKHIDDLHAMFRFFHRCVSVQSDNIWKEKYHDILSTVQAGMQHVYHSSLLVEDFESTSPFP